MAGSRWVPVFAHLGDYQTPAGGLKLPAKEIAHIYIPITPLASTWGVNAPFQFRQVDAAHSRLVRAPVFNPLHARC